MRYGWGMKRVAITSLSLTLVACGASSVTSRDAAPAPTADAPAPTPPESAPPPAESAPTPSELPPPLPPAPPLLIEAESGQLGADFERQSTEAVEHIAIKSMAAGDKPGSIERVARYTVQFSAPGDYDLYARVRVGPGGQTDDSCFVANGLGVKAPEQAPDWVVANGLGTVGYEQPEELIGLGGHPTPGGWHWVNLSRLVRAPARLSFEVPAGELTQTFMLGGREDGFAIDQLAFAPARISHKVSEIEQRRPGRYIPPPPPPPPFTPPGPAMALGKSKFLGGAYGGPQSLNFAAYFNQVTPENGGKWGTVEAVRDVMAWGELDAAYAFAREHALPFKLHVMVWGNQQPAWIESLPPREQREEIEEWFSEVARRYPVLDTVEVVNEPLHDPPNKPGEGGGNYLAALGGDGKTGWDWVLESFRLGRRYFPNSRLMLNDFSILNSPADARRYKAIIELLQKERLIDAVGVQGHAFATHGPLEVMRENLDLLASTKLPIFVTELDIDGIDDGEQLAEYQRVFPLFWEHPAVHGVTLWGYRPGMWRTAQGAFLALTNGAERPALVWLQQYVRSSKAEPASARGAR